MYYEFLPSQDLIDFSYCNRNLPRYQFEGAVSHCEDADR